jgi:hypothetical protein
MNYYTHALRLTQKIQYDETEHFAGLGGILLSFLGADKIKGR